MAIKSLIIDASTAVFQAGILKGDRFSNFSSSINDTLGGFFALITPFADDLDVEEIIFCEGPGKLLGIRATIMFTRILTVAHPLIYTYSYNTLALVDKMRAILNISPEGTICVPKNNTQYYILEGTQISLTDYEGLQLQRKPIYCLATHHRALKNHDLIPIQYNLEAHGNILRGIIVANKVIETAYDPQNEYKKWDSIRHKNIF
ncbi:MAG: hypothetical protein LBS71_01375 [Puniceicoccales bacterium]|nr:hypothetical protein [Puniceicoccales bacterium]